jgi:hypothetical protein
MREIVRLEATDLLPAATALPGLLGTPAGVAPDERTRAASAEALRWLATEARPAAVLADIAAADFAEVYRGDGRNDAATPLETIHPRAEALALFAVTLGPAVDIRVQECFARREFLLGSLVDAAASEAVERAADRLEARLALRLHDAGALSHEAALLRYSPGYCGWHLSGQRALFARLRPEEIGITLRESCLMEPLKSMTGVIVAGPVEIHDFRDDFPVCDECRTRGCRERITSVKRKLKGEG